MVGGLVLSIFPGLGLLDRGFEAEGFTIVRGPDLIWGGDVRRFHPPAGVFEGVIGGDPCQSHSALANLVRANGFKPRFPDMTGEFARIVEEAQPGWFLRENVPRAPEIEVDGYGVHSFKLDNADLDRGDGLGFEQKRDRRFWFGTLGREASDLRMFMSMARERAPFALALCGDPRRSFIPGGQAEVNAIREGLISKVDREEERSRPRHTLADMCALQGLPRDFMDHVPFTTQGKRQALGNGVPQSMARALARSVLKAALR